MADASKLKKRPRNSLGVPPGPDEVATSLNSPEVAPAAEATEVVPEPIAKEQPIPATPMPSGNHELASQESNAVPYVRRDGRSARKTHRIIAFATRVTPEFDNEVRDIADREGIKLVEVLENALAAYKQQKGY
ncbi:hypothetical protein [Leclercia adecarboxylata]|uniref:hypothetical protein n=1 Tax=Leclercia adecarboxylata TaxID=83655 RepID=UPI002949C27F|nr:hypothetical protein [Leclercia adecarboxylata]MDV5624363.1 hypothetical protein [Leclercia adecarboxylata]